MSDTDPAVYFVQRALELRQAGETFDVAELCGDHPALIAAVEAALEMSEVLPKAISDDPLLNAVLDDRYRLDEYIGAGAMGKVFSGRDKSLGREVAVKVLQHGILATEQRQQRFVREAKVLASLDHPHIVRIFDHGLADNGFHYIVMERLQGASLSRVLDDQIEYGDQLRAPAWALAGESPKRQNWLTQIAEWGVQLASALQSAHDEGVFHRDLKPSNIIIDRVGNAHLLDFGIATREGEGSLTLGGTTLGTPWYMAPEQAADAKHVTEQVDVYGLCATLYHLATFEPPYDGDYRQVLIDLQSKDPRPPKSVRSELPSDLCAIIEKGMDRKLSRRYQNARELEQDLRAFLAHMPVSARPLTPLARKWRKVQARPVPYVTAVVVLLAIVAAVFISSEMTKSNRAAADAAEREYQTLFAGWPPAVSFEGSLETRLLFSPEERESGISRADRILELRPEDEWSRMVRSALLLDDGQLAKATKDISYFAQSNDTAFFRALLSRYRDADGATRGAGAVDLDGLPEPTTNVGRFVLGFHFARKKDYAAADDHLARASQHPAARYARLSVLLKLGVGELANTPHPEEFATVRSDLQFLVGAFGFSTARTTFIDGTLRMIYGDYGGAVDPLEASVAHSPSFNAVYNLAGVYRKLGRKREAIRLFEQCLRKRPWNKNALRDLAQVKAELGEFDAARGLAQSLPAQSRLVEPWHREYVLGFIEFKRYEANARSDSVVANASVEAARAHFEASLKLVKKDKDAAFVRSNIEELRAAVDADYDRYFDAVVKRLRRDQLNVSELRTLVFVLQHVRVDPSRQRQLQSVLNGVVVALARREQTKAAEASAKKK